MTGTPSKDTGCEIATGDQYTLETIQELDAKDTTELEQLLKTKLATRINGKYVTFQVDTIACIDITDTDDITEIND